MPIGAGMEYACTTSTQSGQGVIVVRQISSITSDQVGIVAEAVAALSASWLVESHDDYEGYRSIVVFLDHDDAVTFAISGKADRIELSEIVDDVLYPRGRFGRMGDAATALVGLMRRA